MGALLGLLTSFSITSTEIFSRRITNEIGPIVATSIVSLVAAITTVVVALATDGTIIARDMILGGLSGICFGVGMATYFEGLRISSSAVMGPTVASLSALIPFGWAAVSDAAPPLLGYVGAAAAVVGLLLVTTGGAAASNVRGGLPFGLASGTGYGVGTSLLIDVSDSAGSWPLVSQRVIAFALIAGFAMARRRPLVPPGRFVVEGTIAGTVSGTSSVLLLAGLTANPAAASITATLFPAWSVAAGRVLFKDSVSRIQVLGMMVVIGGTIAIVAA